MQTAFFGGGGREVRGGTTQPQDFLLKLSAPLGNLGTLTFQLLNVMSAMSINPRAKPKSTGESKLISGLF